MDELKQKKIAKMVGAAVASYRTEAGFTQEEVAEKMGIGNEAVSRMERGAVLPTVGRLFEFADLFDCQISDFLLGASDRIQDQAGAIAHLIKDLAAGDREMVVDIVKTLGDRLKTKTADRKVRR
jgi:transcriptional regulator with XRE-family HTH domain